MPDSGRLNLTIGLPLRNKETLATLLQQIYDPASPKYHQYLSPSEFTEQFGPSQEDYRALIDFARTNGLKITRTHPNRTLLQVSVSATDIQRVFHVNENVYQHPTEARTFYCPDKDPSIAIGVNILGIKGLDDFNLPRAYAEKKPTARHGRMGALGGSGPGGGYIGKDFRKAYAPGVTLTGAGQTVALVEFDGYYPSDITAYESEANLPSVLLTNVLVDGFSGQPGFNNDEVAADTELLIAMAPGLFQIVIYEEGVFSPVDDMLNRIATDDTAAQISCSWMFITADSVTDQIFQQYSAQGQSFFCASGDFGALSPDEITPPLSDPYITLVGGTVLSTSSSGGAWTSEVAWADTTGGYTTNYGIPTWQTNVNMSSNQGSSTYRNTPDVAMCAENVFVIFDDGTEESFEGTSAAAPLWAGFTALINQQSAQYGNGTVGFLNPALYAIGAGPRYTSNFHDIVVGNNTNSDSPNAFFAVPGFDLCTGWGTPTGSNLINTLAPPDILVMLPPPGFASSGPGGGPFTIAAQSFLLTNESTQAVNWALQTDVPWLSTSATNGTLEPGGTVNVVGSLTGASSHLFVGNHIGHLWLTNLTDGLVHHGTFTLQVSNQLTLSPAGGLEFYGPPSGPFSATTQSCELSNASPTQVLWSVVPNPPWLSVSPSNGVLEPYMSTSISCSVNATATNLPAGAYSAVVGIANDSFGSSGGLPAFFLIGQMVQNGGFETGNLADWILIGNPLETIVYSNPAVVHSGTYGAYLGQTGSMGYLEEEIPTIPGNLYSLSFWLEATNSPGTNEFSVSWEGNVLCDYTNFLADAWTNLQFTVTAADSNTLLQIGFVSEESYFGLDDVSVMAAPPTIESVNPSSGPILAGTTVSISGVGFQTLVTVSFGGIPAASVTFNSNSNLTVVTPIALIPGPVNVVIANADGQTATLTNRFVFVAKPLLVWTNPPAVTYGTVLGAGQLDASANVPGTFAYIPPGGTALDAGTNTLSLIFTPLDGTDYLGATNQVELTVLPASLSLTASNASRPYGITNPAFVGSIVGLQNGDDIIASFVCAALPNSPPGAYAIVPIPTDPDDRLINYKVLISNGILTILAPVVPTFQSVTMMPNSISFGWNSTPGVNYQVQYNNTLDTTNWINLGDLITATNATTEVSDSISNIGRFYRVLLVPQ